jgi:phospholipid transport system substrate-binding protein
MNQILNKIKSLFLVVTLLINTNAALADQTQDVKNYVNTLANQVIAIVKNKSNGQQAKTDQLFSLLKTNFNLDWMAKFVIAQNYRQLNPTQQVDYQNTYAKYFLYSYLPNLMKYTDESFKINKVLEQTPGNFTVETQILRTNGQPPISINYQVKPKALSAEGYQVIDVVVEGVSAIMSQRSEFSSIVQQTGPEGFITKLKTKVSQLETKSNDA